MTAANRVRRWRSKEVSRLSTWSNGLRRIGAEPVAEIDGAGNWSRSLVQREAGHAKCFARCSSLSSCWPVPVVVRRMTQADTTRGWELKPPAPDAVAVALTEKMPGIYPAGSRIKARDALGGFGPCDNYPKDLGEKNWGAKGVVSVVAFPDEPV